MKLLRINAENPEKELVSFVAREVALGRIIIYPTDTVYGIGCRLDPDSVKKIFEIKNRSLDKPLSIAFKDLASAKEYVSLSQEEERYIKEHLDKPMTFVVKKKDTVPDIVTSGKNTVGIRIIDDPFIRELISHVGEPIILRSRLRSSTIRFIAVYCWKSFLPKMAKCGLTILNSFRQMVVTPRK